MRGGPSGTIVGEARHWFRGVPLVGLLPTLVLTMPTPPVLPLSLALVDEDAHFSALLRPALNERGVALRWFASAEALLADPQAHAQVFYVLSVQQPGLGGLQLLRALRERSDAGALLLSTRAAPGLFERALAAGADMHLVKPVSPAQLLLAVGCVHRRVLPAQAHQRAWRLDRARRQLISPDGAIVDLSANDCAVLECLVDACGHVVPPLALARRLGWADIQDPNQLHATIYRLRRRIGQATAGMAPLQAKSRQGYVFKAPLTAL